MRLTKWKCPTCYRTAMLSYNSTKPLPICVGGPKIHGRILMVCEHADLYAEVLERVKGFLATGVTQLAIIIHPRNYWRYPLEKPGDKREDFGSLVSSEEVN